MQFLSDYWWLFLISAWVCGSLAMVNQIGRMRRMFGEGGTDFTKGLTVLALLVLTAAASLILMIVGLVAKFTGVT